MPKPKQTNSEYPPPPEESGLKDKSELGNIAQNKQELVAEIDKRLQDKIIEPTNAALLKKLINNADSLNEAISIAELGTTYKRTGLHFDKRLEKMGNTIKYFKRNTELSFETDKAKTTHRLIIGDNYDALLNLLIEYRGKIDVIYIDPPYGKDSIGEFAKTNYENAITRDNLLSMLYPRLVLAKQLLSDNGVIFCSIDDKNQAYAKCLFDDVFGESNFVAQAIWHSNKNIMKQSKSFRKDHEYIIVFSKDAPELEFNRLTNKMKFSNPDNDPKGNWFSSNAVAGGKYEFEITLPGGKSITRKWNFTESEYKNGLVGVFLKGNNVPRRKIYEAEYNQNTAVSSSLLPESVGSTTTGINNMNSVLSNAAEFDNPKPVDLMKYLLSLSTRSDSVILDYFAGSGTTGQAVLELNKEDSGNRQFILATSNEITDSTPNGVVADVTSKRLKRVMTGECYDGTRDFKWLEKNEPLGDNLDVYDIAAVANNETTKGKTPFDVIDETIYGKEKMSVLNKIKWVCENFDGTQMKLVETANVLRK